MFTLGNKEVIANTAAQFPLTPAAATVAAVLNIKGLGTFQPTTITSAYGRRYSAAQLEKMQITCPTSAQLGIADTATNVPVSFRVKVYTLRQASETSIDFVKKGRPLILEILVQGNTTGTDIATLLKTALAEYQSKYPVAIFPFTWATTVDAYLTLTGTDGFYSFGEDVTFTVNRMIIPYTATVTKKFITTIHVNAVVANGATHVHVDGVTGLMVGDTISFDKIVATEFKITEIVTSTGIVYITPSISSLLEAADTNHVWKVNKAVEVINDGKYLEENVRMSTTYTSDTYAINPIQVPIIGATYTMLTWTANVSATEGGWESHATPGIVATAVNPQSFTMYLNDATCLAGATNLVTYISTWLEAACVANISGYVALSSWKKANGASAESIANFIA